jgi:hypothetical protein
MTEAEALELLNSKKKKKKNEEAAAAAAELTPSPRSNPALRVALQTYPD